MNEEDVPIDRRRNKKKSKKHKHKKKHTNATSETRLGDEDAYGPANDKITSAMFRPICDEYTKSLKNHSDKHKHRKKRKMSSDE